jgi:hypothetical protein
MVNEILNAANAAQDFLNQNNPLTNQQQNSFRSDGFLLPATYSADGNGLPYNNVPSNKQGKINRNIITWFIPQFGIVRMFINPNNIVYTHRKLIGKEPTKGGFTLQYWGEDLTTLNIRGTTGSSGIEGINVLYEMYRAEQYAFDSVGLTLAANNFNNDLSNNLINGASSLFGGSETTQAGTAGILGGVLGLNSPNNSLAPRNIPSLAQLAFGVEMYYNGWVFRGYFENINITESAENFLMNYDITFIATQKRGYRTNYFPWARSAKDGPSNYTTSNSFSGNVIGE